MSVEGNLPDLARKEAVAWQGMVPSINGQGRRVSSGCLGEDAGFMKGIVWGGQNGGEGEGHRLLGNTLCTLQLVWQALLENRHRVVKSAHHTTPPMMAQPSPGEPLPPCLVMEGAAGIYVALRASKRIKMGKWEELK